MESKSYYFTQVADLRIEGIGIHASYSINLTVKDVNIGTDKEITIAATGKSKAAKAAGSGRLLFCCKVRSLLDNKIYILERKKGERWAVGLDYVPIGSVTFLLSGSAYVGPALEIESGYFYDSGYVGTVPPIPGSFKRVITLSPFQG
ncbi:hypothetical protein [Enterobacter sp. Bisph1]|uniref:hypothetical protein n=1 Tax=Enterobacter sp. Bisph1 TaxID=1274399 RepID=UPI00057C26D2|nr:hypothetical protein [Enterobacter sp. Bisph1]